MIIMLSDASVPPSQLSIMLSKEIVSIPYSLCEWQAMD